MTGAATRPAEAKRALRAAVIAARARLSQEERRDKSRAIAARVEALPVVAAAPLVALYAPLGSEVDARELAERLLSRGARLAFPRSIVAERRLEFCRCDPSELVAGPLGAREPPPGAPALDPDDVPCVVMPGVAFSTDGHRLGRGGGFYDAALAAMPRAARIGVAFEVQLVPSVPREAHDAPLDAIVTESRALTFPRRPGDPT